MSQQPIQNIFKWFCVSTIILSSMENEHRSYYFSHKYLEDESIWKLKSLWILNMSASGLSASHMSSLLILLALFPKAKRWVGDHSRMWVQVCPLQDLYSRTLVVSEPFSAPFPRAHLSPSSPVWTLCCFCCIPLWIYTRKSKCYRNTCQALLCHTWSFPVHCFEIQFRSLTLDMCWDFLKS